MADRKWEEGKQKPSMLLGSAVPGSSLVSFYFLWAILCPQAVGSYSISQSAGGTSQNIIFETLQQIGRPAL